MDFLLLGNHPFLDFINTCPVIHGEPVEQLGDGGDLLNLLGRLGLPDTPALGRIVDEETHKAATEAREMREDFRALLFRLFEPVRRSPNEAGKELATVNQWLYRLGPPVLRSNGESLDVSYDAQGYFVPLLRAALDLFSSPKYMRIRKCSDPDCVLWYVDTTKSQTRRWCSMSLCGNVHKAREFRKRH